MKVYTVGYEGQAIDGFLSMLKKQGINHVVDIRELPLSRKPGFSKKSLSAALNLSGIEYSHMVALGCPKPVRDQYRIDKNWNNYKKGFASHLLTQADAIKQLCDLVAEESCALLCFEADANFCHRSIVAESVRTLCGADVVHLRSGANQKANPGSRLLACS